MGNWASLESPYEYGEGPMLAVDKHEEERRMYVSRTPSEAKCVSCISLIVVPLFVFLLPYWSYQLNDKYFGTEIYGRGRICESTADELSCPDTVTMSYSELVTSNDLLAHRQVGGEIYGCACEQGFLGDWVCPLGQETFSISYFISTAPGTGAMAAFCAWGIISQWLYGQGSIEAWRGIVRGSGMCNPARCSKQSCGYKVAALTTFIFQIFFGLFLMGTLCIAPRFHTVVVGTFILAEFIHYLTIAYVAYYNAGFATPQARIIIVLAIVAVAALVIGTAIPPGWFPEQQYGLYAFWLGECIGLTAGFAIAPILTILGD